MNYKILVVENNDENSLNIKEFLEKMNYRIDISNSVKDAIFKIENIKYSVILLEIELLDFHGFEILKFLNKSKINIPVIVISEDTDLKTKISAFRLGAVDYIVKPIDLDELEARIMIKLKF